jgi:lipid-A-disaccharide synthase-like uncharacterized protein
MVFSDEVNFELNEVLVGLTIFQLDSVFEMLVPAVYWFISFPGGMFVLIEFLT